MMHKIFTGFLCFSSIFAWQQIQALTVLTVNSNLDTQVFTGGAGVGTTGDLRFVLNTVNLTPDAYQVVFNLPAGNETISIQGMLPILNQNAANNLAINGSNIGSGTNVTINGGGIQRGFIAQQGPIRIQNMNIENTTANGGQGGVGGGGGGLGAGGALFINQAQVVISNVNMINNVARGGNGGVKNGTTLPTGVTNTAGGGGMGGNGGSLGKAGGGGLGGNGGNDPLGTNPAGGGGVGPGGDGGSLGSQGIAGSAFGTPNAGQAADGTLGGARSGGGGSGTGVANNGGGGGVNGANGTLATGGNGGFGGGGAGQFGNGGFGGGGGSHGNGGFGGGGGSDGNGGFGGGAGSSDTVPKSGGVGGGTVATNAGNGGAGVGGGIFLNASNEYGGGGGSLTFEGSGNLDGNTAVGGQGATTSAGNGADAGDAIFATSGQPILINPDASDQITVNGSIADDSSNSLPGDGSTPGHAVGISIVKTGEGILTLLGNNTFAQSVHLVEGILQIDKDEALGEGGVPLIVDGPSTLETLASFSSPRPIELNRTLTFNTNTNTIIWDGIITGSGGIKKTGRGLLRLSNMFNTGNVDVLQGELVVKNSVTRLISNNFSVISGSQLTLEQDFGTVGVYQGQISGDGMLNINKEGGAGIIALTGNSNTFGGSTVVFNGALDLEGVLGGNILVNSLLIGNGRALGNVTINRGGRIAPGLGTFTIDGNFLQKAGSAYLATFNANTNSLIKVGNMATLESGSSLELLLASCPKLNTSLTIMTADGEIIGEYTDVRILNSDTLLATVVYDGKTVVVVFKTNFVGITETFNQQQIATQLTSSNLNLSPELQNFLQGFCLLKREEAQRVLDQLSGLQFGNAFFIADLANRRFVRNIFDPLRPMIVANPCAPYVCTTYRPEFDLWASLSGGAAFFHKGGNNINGFHLRDWAFTFGGHYQLCKQLTVGAAIAVEKDWISYRVGSARNRATLLGIYSLYRPKRFYVFADINFGHHAIRNKRNIDISDTHFSSKSNQKINQLTGYLEVGLDFGLHTVLFQPFFAIETGWSRFGSFTEQTGAPFDLSVRGKSWNNSGTRLGFHLSSAPLLVGLSAAIDLSWNYRLSGKRNVISERFRDFGDCFKINGLRIHKNTLEANIFLSQQFNRCWTLYFAGDVIGWQNVFAFNLTAGVILSW